MIKYAVAPSSFRLLFGLLALVVLLDLAMVVIDAGRVLDDVRLVLALVIWLGVMFDNKASYFVFYTLVTISIYGTLVLMVIELANSKGHAIAHPTFWLGTVVAVVLLVLAYRLMGRDEIKHLYIREKTGPGAAV